MRPPGSGCVFRAPGPAQPKELDRDVAGKVAAQSKQGPCHLKLPLMRVFCMGTKWLCKPGDKGKLFTLQRETNSPRQP